MSELPWQECTYGTCNNFVWVLSHPGWGTTPVCGKCWEKIKENDRSGYKEDYFACCEPFGWGCWKENNKFNLNGAL